MPLLRNPDKSKLSKRKNPTSILFYKRMGFMPQAMLNYLARMGWSMPDEREQFTFTEMVQHFDLNRVSLGGPIFAMDKLRWLNSLWLRELKQDEFIQQFSQWAFADSHAESLIPHLKPRIEVFSDVAPLAQFFLSGMLDIKLEDFRHNAYAQQEQIVSVLQYGLWTLEDINNWQKEDIEHRLFALAQRMDIKVRDFLFPFFIAIAGSASSISVLDSMSLLGADLSRARIRHAIEVLGGVGKKKLKKMEKDFHQLPSNG